MGASVESGVKWEHVRSPVFRRSGTIEGS